MNATLYFIAQEDWPASTVIAEIPTILQTIGTNLGHTFPVHYRQAVIAGLGWSPDQVVELPTSVWGIDQLKIDTYHTPPDVQIEYHNEALGTWQIYLEEVAAWCRQQSLQLPVRIHYAWGLHPFYVNGQIHLCFGGEANFGVKFWSHDRLIKYQRGHIWIGELGPEHDECRRLIPILLPVCVPCVLGGHNPAEEQKFITTCNQTNDREFRRIEHEIATCENTISELQHKLVQAVRRHDFLCRERENRGGGERPALLKRIFQQLLERPYVRAVISQQATFSVFTDRAVVNLTGRDGVSELYDIGQFRIDINTEGGDGCVKLFNLDRQVSRRPGLSDRSHHPHVSELGVPCLGSIKTVIPRYLGQEEYLAVVDLLWNYLQTVVPTDVSGQSIVQWPCFRTTQQ